MSSRITSVVILALILALVIACAPAPTPAPTAAPPTAAPKPTEAPLNFAGKTLNVSFFAFNVDLINKNINQPFEKK